MSGPDDLKTTRADATQPHQGVEGIVAAPHGPRSEPSYELGEVVVALDKRPEKAKTNVGGLIAWVLLLVAIAAATFFALRFYLPLLDERAERIRELTAAKKDNETLARQVEELQNQQRDLAAQVAKREQELQALQSTQDELAGKLQAEIDKGNVAISQSKGQIVVDLVDKILFPSGEAELADSGKEILRQVGEIFLKVPDKVIQVGGHTDDVPISPKLMERFASNWELSAARALNVVHFLEDDVKVPGARLMPAGFGSNRPTASNKTPAGRKKNRRIEVILLPLLPPGR